MTFAPWPHQLYAVEQVWRCHAAGMRAVCVATPTGGGKSWDMLEIIRQAKEREWRTLLLTNRRLLLKQIQSDLAEAGIKHGIRASGFQPQEFWPVQLSSIQTELSRVYKHKTWEPFRGHLALIDEAHLQRGRQAEKLIRDLIEAGIMVVGFTATPIDIGHIYEHLIVAGTTSELRKCKALLPCYTYAPDEPDTRDLKPTKTGEFVEGDVVKAIMSPTIFARVIETHRQLNPEMLPAIGFAPSVQTAMWFATEYRKVGIPAASIDGDFVCFGELDSEGEPIVSADKSLREKVFEQSKSGEIKIIWNRFVLREGINLPWLYHGIFATVFGSLSSFLQAGGRLLRYFPSLEHVIGQDHGGNWHRHGSLNADRLWQLNETSNQIAESRFDRLRNKEEAEPIRCPKCSMIRAAGRVCPQCGFVAAKSLRVVVQKDGNLKEMAGDIYKPRLVRETSDTEKKWTACFFRCKKSGMTFRQATALFFRENHYWPPETLPYMPKSKSDTYQKIADVPYGRLNGRPAPVAIEQPATGAAQQHLSFQ